MAYTPTNWVDGTTPVDVSNLNKIESALTDHDEQIESLSNGTIKHYEISVAQRLSAGTYEILWKSGTSNLDYYADVILSFRAFASDSYADLILSTYGVGTGRTKVTPFHSGSNFSYSVDSENTGLIVTLGGSAVWVVGITVLLGEMPTIVSLDS